MRIAIVSPTVDRQHGTERAVAELIERLAAKYSDRIDLFLEESCSYVPPLPSIRRHRVRTIRAPHLFQFMAWLYFNRSSRRSAETSDGARSDVTFSPGVNAFDADVILVHVVFHRVRELHRAGTATGIRAWHRSLYYSLLCHFENRIYRDRRVRLAAVSSRTAKQLNDYFDRHDVAVIPNGVDSDWFSPEQIGPLREDSRRDLGVAPAEIVVLLVGNDWRNKGLAALLSAIQKCSHLPIRLLVVGQDEQAPFRAIAETLGVAGRVSFLRPVVDIRVLYAAADILSAPSLEDSFNLPVLEAMACGLPVIASLNAGVSEWLTHDHDSLLLRDPNAAEELAQAIRTLATDSAKRSRLCANAVGTAKRLSWDAHADRLRELLASAAEAKVAAEKTR